MSKTSHSRLRPVVPSVAPVQPDRTPVAYALRDLAVAPENLRFAESRYSFELCNEMSGYVSADVIWNDCIHIILLSRKPEIVGRSPLAKWESRVETQKSRIARYPDVQPALNRAARNVVKEPRLEKSRKNIGYQEGLECSRQPKAALAFNGGT